MHSPLSLGNIPRYDLQPAPGDETAPLVKIEVTDESTYRKNQIFFSPHRKNYYLLLYVKRGNGRHWIDMVPYQFEPHTLFFTNPE